MRSRHADFVQFTAVVEPDREKREFFAVNHKIHATRCFENMDKFFTADLNDLDGVIIATLENQRLEPIFRAMERHWPILAEKPLCTSAKELFELADRARNYSNILLGIPHEAMRTSSR